MSYPHPYYLDPPSIRHQRVAFWKSEPQYAYKHYAYDKNIMHAPKNYPNLNHNVKG